MKEHIVWRRVLRRHHVRVATTETFIKNRISLQCMALKEKVFAPLAAATLAAYVTPNGEAATVSLGSNNGGALVFDNVRGLAADGSTIRVYGDDNLHRYDTNFNATGSSSLSGGQVDAASHSAGIDAVTGGANGFTTYTFSNGLGVANRGLAGAQQTRALHGHVNIGGVDYTLATTNDPSGELTTAWYNTSNIGLGAVVQTVDTSALLTDLGVSSASDITGGAMYLGIGGDADNLSHYMPLINTETLIGQVNPTNGFTNTYSLAGVDGIQDVALVGNKLYALDHIANNVGSVAEWDFSGNQYAVAVPEPSSTTLLGLGALILGGYRRRF